jgi:hypothetical protein
MLPFERVGLVEAKLLVLKGKAIWQLLGQLRNELAILHKPLRLWEYQNALFDS